jgi:hypothetical protein
MPALAGMMTAEEARKFVAGKVFAFTCFDGTRGAGRTVADVAGKLRATDCAMVNLLKPSAYWQRSKATAIKPNRQA